MKGLETSKQARAICKWCLGLVLLVSGCADTHQVIKTAGTASAVRLAAEQTVYIAVPQDGSFGARTYGGSGHKVVGILAGAFSPHARRVESGNSIEDEQKALATARAKSSSILIVPTILHWEHRNTAWSGIPNRSSIRIQLIDVPSGKTLDSVVIEGTGKIMTFGGDTPEGLLPEPVGSYVRGLYN